MDDIPIFLGMVIDPQISQIQVVNDQKKQSAKINRSGDGNNYWFIALPQQKDVSYKVEGLDAEGKVLTSKTSYYYH